MKKIFVLLTVAMVFWVPTAAAENAYELDWVRQLGTSNSDESFGVAADGQGNVFIGGYTEGDLAGANQGLRDAFVSKYDMAGTPIWTRQLGSSASDYCRDVSVDNSGNVFIGGYTSGSLEGQPFSGGGDAFVSKYGASGNHLWTRQQGPAYGRGVATDSDGNVFITGETSGSLDGQPYAGGEDVFVTKYSASGNRLWTRLVGTTTVEYSEGGVATDAAGNVYIGAMTQGYIAVPDTGDWGAWNAFVCKFNASGDLLWTRQASSAHNDMVYGAAVDEAGSVFLTGWTDGDLGGQSNAGGSDAFLVKYDTMGDYLWTRLLGTSRDEHGRGAATDAVGNVFIAGVTTGSLSGSTFGGDDAFVSKFDNLGNILWTQQLGTPSTDQSWAVATDMDGNVLTSGYTYGGLDGMNAGNTDAFVAKYVVPETATLGSLLVGGFFALRRRTI